MRIDLTRETPVPLADVPKLSWIPRRRGGRRLHLSSVHRWCSRGLRGRRLEFVQLGGTRVTTVEALFRFFDSLASSNATTVQEAAVVDKEKAARVERELDAAGI
jgi:hypothetical protein